MRNNILRYYIGPLLLTFVPNILIFYLLKYSCYYHEQKFSNKSINVIFWSIYGIYAFLSIKFS